MRDLMQKRSARAREASTLWSGKRTFGALLAAALCAGGATISLAQDGKAVFDAKCAACHSIGGGPRVGPDLKGVVAKRGKEGTVAAVLDPAKAGLKPTMPNLGVPVKDAQAIVAYLDQAQASAGAAPAAKAGAAPAAQAAAHPDEIQLGQDLFEGKVRFAKGGASCNACHDVRNDKVASGGILAAELSLVFSRMGRQGMQSVLANSPFPVMQAAYNGKDLSEKEISALIAFLQHVEKEHSRQLPRETGMRMFSAGVGGVIVLAGILSLAGRRRKKQSVNQDIYDRQVKAQ